MQTCGFKMATKKTFIWVQPIKTESAPAEGEFHSCKQSLLESLKIILNANELSNLEIIPAV